jgi:predicted transcriptional regulator
MPADANREAAYIAADVLKAMIAAAQVTGLIPDMFRTLHATVLGTIDPTATPEPAEAPKPQPAVPVKKSVTPDHIVSLLDGKPYKSLKRHLTGRGYTPESYREAFGLAADYPMTAPNYALRRAEIARSTGLGRKKV